jgi:hypothetical protein
LAIVNRGRLALIIAVLGMGGATAAFAQAANPFTQLAGSWRGSGVVRLLDGRSERLSCRGTYAEKAGGSQLSLSIRCQSENNKIDMRSSLSYENGGVAGHWEERNFGLEGDVMGSAAAASLRLQISGQLQGSMAVSVSGSSHRVTVTTAGPGFKSVSITFSRG